MHNVVGCCSECGDSAMKWVGIVSGLCPHHEELMKEQGRKAKVNKAIRLRSKGIRPMSYSRQKDWQIYVKHRAEFLKDNPRCAAYPHMESDQIHHMRGRIGSLLYDKNFFLAVSGEGHRFIESNPEWALSMGYRELRTN